MGEVEIYSKDGTLLCTTHRLEYNGDMMGERSVKVTLQSDSPIELGIGCYLTYRNDRYEIWYDPSVTKRCEPQKIGNAFVYQDIVFKSEQNELADAMFLDVVLNDNQIHYTALPVFSFYCETIQDFADRLQANLDRVYTGTDGWKVEVTSPISAKTKQSISVSNQNCWEVLAQIYDVFESTFMVDTVTSVTKGQTQVHKRIIIGKTGDNVGTFRFGKDNRTYTTSHNGICELRRATDESAAVITRLRAYGNTTNLPYHYYHNLKCVCYIPGSDIISVENHGNVTMTVTLPLSVTRRNQFSNTEVVIKCHNITMDASMAIAHTEDTSVMVLIYNAQLYSALAGKQYRIEFLEGIRPSEWVPAYKDYTGSVPNNFAVNNLMLPNFGAGEGKTLDPYIDSDNIDTYGVREASLYWDGSDGREDIYPTIEGITAKQLRDAEYDIPDSYADSLRLDSLKGGSSISDSGLFPDEGNVTPPDFTVDLYDIGFNISDYATAGKTPSISFKDGKLGGRDFEIRSVVQNADQSYTVTCMRKKDESTGYYYPNSNYNATAGDFFVLTDIEMPNVYVDAAAQRLLTAATAWLALNDKPRYTYEPKIDNVFMQRQDDWAKAGTGRTSYHDTIREGQTFSIEDEDLDIDIEIPIKHLTISEQEEQIPRFTITLDDKMSVGLIQRVLNQIDITRNVNVGGGVSSADINKVMREVKAGYLSKTEDDSAQGRIGFEKGIEAHDTETEPSVSAETIQGNDIISNTVVTESAEINGNLSAESETVEGNSHVGSSTVDGGQTVGGNQTVTGNQSVGGTLTAANETITNDLNVGGTIETTNLQVNGTAHFWEVVIDKISSVGGSVMFTPADGFKIDHYSSVSGGYKIYWQGGEGSQNMWAVGDQALCRNFKNNAQEYAEKYWWALVTAVGSTTIDGKTYHYITISSSTKDGTISLAQGDDVVMCGHRKQSGETDAQAAARQGCVYIACSNSLDRDINAPLIAQYQGINDFSLSTHRTNYQAQNGSKFVGSFEVVSGNNKTPLDEYISGHEPYIGTDNYWYVYDLATHQYRKTIEAKGEQGNSPYIGNNGHWWIGTTDTGVKAEGTSITITDQSITYGVNTSGTVKPTTWQTNVPTTSEGQYLWTRTIVTYSDGTTTTSYSVSYHGVNGIDGDDAVEFVVNPSHLEFTFNSTTQQIKTSSATILCYRGGQPVSGVTYTITKSTNCTSSKSDSSTISISVKNDTTATSITGETRYLAPSSGSVEVKAVIGSMTYYIVIDWSVNQQTTFSQILADENTFKTTYESFVTSVNGTLTSHTTQLQQTAESMTALATTQTQQGNTIEQHTAQLTLDSERINLAVSRQNEYARQNLAFDPLYRGDIFVKDASVSEHIALDGTFISGSYGTASLTNQTNSAPPFPELDNLCYRLYANNISAPSTGATLYGRYANKANRFEVASGRIYTISLWIYCDREDVLDSSKAVANIKSYTTLTADSSIGTPINILIDPTTQEQGWSSTGGTGLKYKRLGVVNTITSGSTTWKQVAASVQTSTSVSRYIEVIPYVNIHRPSASPYRLNLYYSEWRIEDGEVPSTDVFSNNVERNLFATGIDITHRKIVATTDTFEIQNNSGQQTLYFDSEGNMSIKGIYNSNAVVIDSTNVSKYLIPIASPDDINTWNTWTDYTANHGQYQESYYVYGSATEQTGASVDIFSPFYSKNNGGNTIEIDEDDWKHVHSADVMMLDGNVRIGAYSSSSPDAYNIAGSDSTQIHSWFNLIGDTSQNRNVILLPYMSFIGTSGGKYVFDAMRTPTRNGGVLHLITIEEIRSLVGKRITFSNDTGATIYILTAGKPSEAQYTTYYRQNFVGSHSDNFPISTYGNAFGMYKLNHGQSMTVEYQEAVRQETNSSNTDASIESVDVVPLLISVSDYEISQPFNKDVITDQSRTEGFGVDNFNY